VKRSCPCSLGMGGADLDYLVDIATICVRPDYLIARGWASRTRSSQSCRGLAKKVDAAMGSPLRACRLMRFRHCSLVSRWGVVAAECASRAGAFQGAGGAARRGRFAGRGARAG